MALQWCISREFHSPRRSPTARMKSHRIRRAGGPTGVPKGAHMRSSARISFKEEHPSWSFQSGTSCSKGSRVNLISR